MRRISIVLSTLFLSLSIAAIHGCKKEEPKPPTTPPPSQAPAPQRAEASSTQSLPASVPAGADAAETPPVNAVIPSTTTAAAKAAPDVASGAADGAKIYQTYCQSCHGATGAGDGIASSALNPKPASFAAAAFKHDPNGNTRKGELEDIIAVVRDGAAKYGGSPLMAPWPTLTAEQQSAVAQHVKSLAGG